MKSAVKAERADKDPSFKLEHFQHGWTDPYIWWERLEKHSKSKGSMPREMFSLVVDDVTHAWYASIKENITDADLKREFLLEFGEEADKVWDKQKGLHELTQGTSSANDFVRTVLAKACRCFGVKAHNEFKNEHKEVIISVLVNGFNPRVKALVLTRKAKSLDDIIKAAFDAKCLEETPCTDTVMLMESKFRELMLPMVMKLDSVDERLKSCEDSPRKLGKAHVRWRSPPTSAESSQEPSPIRERPRKRKSFKDAKTSPNSSRPLTPVVDLECYYCGNSGHTKAKCAMWQKKKQEEAATASTGDLDSKSSSIVCYGCGKEGHIRCLCPSKTSKKTGAPCQICRGKDHKADKCPQRNKMD